MAHQTEPTTAPFIFRGGFPHFGFSPPAPVAPCPTAPQPLPAPGVFFPGKQHLGPCPASSQFFVFFIPPFTELTRVTPGLAVGDARPAQRPPCPSPLLRASRGNSGRYFGKWLIPVS